MLGSMVPKELPELLALFRLWLRDVLVVKSTQGKSRVVFREEAKELERQAEKFTYRGLETSLAAIETMQERMSANVNLEVSLEILLYSIREAMQN